MSNYEREAPIRTPIFDGSNFIYWKVRITGYLQSLGTEVWDIVETGYTFPSETPIDTAGKKKYETNAKAVNTVLGSLFQSEFIKVMQLKTTKEIWEKIILSYEGDDQFDSKVSAIEEKQNLQKLTMSQLHGILTAYEMRKGGPSDRREVAFKASGKGDYNQSGLMKYKDEAFKNFKSFKALVENESNRKIKWLRYDREGEFTSDEFFNFFEEHGIRREFCAARTPQQNGVVERMNRMVQQMAHAILDESGTPATF
eukprot:PITA_33975